MKTNVYVISLLCIFLTTQVKSQTTINRVNYFTLGHAYPYYYLDHVEMDTINYSGSSCTWDLSNVLNSGTYDTLSAIDPSGTIFYNEPLVNYNLSNLCLYAPNQQIGEYDDSLYTYIIDNSDSVYFLGNWAYNGLWEVWFYHLTNPELIYTFPLSMGNITLDNFSGTALDMSTFDTCYFNGTREVEVTGVGQLIMPGKAYNNVLQIKSTRSGVLNCGIGLPSTNTYYSFFDPALNGPILELVSSSNFIQEAIYYYDNPLVTSVLELNNPVVINIFPNPTTNKIIIESKFVSTIYDMILTDSKGKTIFIQPSIISANQMEINLEQIPSGLYLLYIKSNKESVVKKIIKI